MDPSAFDEFQSTLACGGVEPAINSLANRFLAERKYHELFDVRLMQARHQLGLSIVLTTPLEELPQPEQGQLEEAYLNACREVGRLLLDEGRFRESWVYLRPTGDAKLVADTLATIKPTDETLGELIGLALHEGVAPALAYSLILSNYGTCNAITTFDAEFGRFGRTDQQAAAALLLKQLYGELNENLRAHIQQHDGAEPPVVSTLVDLVSKREWLFEGGNYHIDTTHLNSVVRIARVIEDRELIRLAWELTEYGRRLDPLYQFAGDEPFAEVYPSHELFFGAQIGRQVDQAITYFREKAEKLSIEDFGSMPAEAYIALLARLNRLDEAAEASARLLPPGIATTGFAPSLLDLSRLSGNFSVLRDLSKKRGELLPYAVSLIAGQGCIENQ